LMNLEDSSTSRVSNGRRVSASSGNWLLSALTGVLWLNPRRGRCRPPER
jgi:hypothetical protein